MSREKAQRDKPEFTYLRIPVEILAMQKINSLEKFIVSDIGYSKFRENGYKVSNAQMASKFGVSRRTIINALNRLKSPKLGLIQDTGRDDFHRCLKLNGTISALFENRKKEKAQPTKQSINFQKPTSSEVEEYAQSIGFEIDGQYFIDTHEARNWMIGRSKMRDWRACVRTWQKREKNNGDRNENREHNEATADFIR